MNDSAFPNPHNAFDTGATLLDLFAKEAMQVMIPMFLTQGESYNIFNYDVIAKKAYEQANAMLKERENWIK